ncbi:calcium and integrin-binding family member 2-like isoform X1 [Toxorhynchites rutilus septentrionalis]|uniref:calcium and integrin-binding family member 2-like isoform X1 n=1 Tax=Toxorhynchites rutilus septentrionalis TaxID=329112 RepID=UPI002478526B|nr:calcium and integrin-binding family member 2-like isoform X1 [Toxorhynchites rutilus septentrionalis]
MGAKKSILTSEQLDEYVELTYLTRWEILLILEKFLGLAPEGITRDLHQRFPHNQIMDIFPQLKYNPFHDRLFHVFSSAHDTQCSFEDILDMFSVMSKSCPHDVKAAWAFRVFDLDNDDMITKEDIVNTCDRLTNNYQLQQDEMENIADVIIMEMDLQNNGSLGQFEFIKAISKVPEFHNSFSFRP